MNLPKWLKLIKNISKKDFEDIQKTINTTELSSYLLDQRDFFVIKNNHNEIASFGRIYTIEKDCEELSSIRVEPAYRWQKVWIYLSQKLIENKIWDFQLFLATKKELEKYYQQVWFQTINENIPEKLIYTWKWAKENWIDFIIMKYMKH